VWVREPLSRRQDAPGDLTGLIGEIDLSVVMIMKIVYIMLCLEKSPQSPIFLHFHFLRPNRPTRESMYAPKELRPPLLAHVDSGEGRVGDGGGHPPVFRVYYFILG
jgi:hypothetical protein